MKSITIKIKMTNAAFEGVNYQHEAARILKELANKIDDGRIPLVLFDVNGNSVGTVKLAE